MYRAAMAGAGFAHVLLSRADATPDAVAFEAFDGSGALQPLTCAQLAARATALAGELTAAGDGPVLLAYPAGLEYAVALFATLLAGRPAIPAFPAGQSTRDRNRLRGIVADARPDTVVAPAPDPDSGIARSVAVPGAAADATPWSSRRTVDQSDVAIVQYTSGSSGRPRGVLVRHESVAANVRAIIESFGLAPGSSAVTWLPPFHDMGLVGGLLTPVAAGLRMRILAPDQFLRAPLTWLHQIADSGAVVSGGPDFAYELCTRRVRSPEQLDGLDLTGWRVAFSGGERVRACTLAAFAQAFAPAGFDPRAFVPCYGLAEATLIVSTGHWNGRAEEPVSCGRPVTGQEVVVVDPARATEVTGEVAGEIWVRGVQVTDGFLSARSDDLFGTFDGRRYLRTGDLGQFRAGELVVTGRLKDMLVVRGANHHATDIEAVGLHAAGRAGRAAAAFLVETRNRPHAVLVLEHAGRVQQADAARVAAAVLTGTGLRLDRTLLVRPGTIPRTSSGKVRRPACRDDYLFGAYADAVGHGWTDGSTHAHDAGGARPPLAQHLAVLLEGIVTGVCEIDRWPRGATFAELGIDSVRAAEVAAVLEAALAVPVPLDPMLGSATTPAQVADALVAGWADDGISAETLITRMAVLSAQADAC